MTTDDNCRWICSSCSVDFHDRFRWTVIDVEPAISAPLAQSDDRGEATR